MEGITLEDLRAQGHVRLRWPSEQQDGGKPFQPFADGRLRHGVGQRQSSIRHRLRRCGDRFAAALHCRLRSRAIVRRSYPLEFLPRKADNYMNSTFANIRRAPADGARDGQPAGDASGGCGSPRPSCRRRYELRSSTNGAPSNCTPWCANSVLRGVVAGKLNWSAVCRRERRNVNALTSERLTDIGRGRYLLFHAGGGAQAERAERVQCSR